MRIEDTCCCGAKLVLVPDTTTSDQMAAEKRHAEWLKAHSRCSSIRADTERSNAFWSGGIKLPW